jgi:hypothetical protein
MKLLVMSILSGLAVACASHPPVQEPPSVAPVAAKTQPGGAVNPTTKNDLNGDKILAMQRQGYTIVNKMGETYYCRQEMKTGTHLPADTVCVTEKEADDLRELTQQRLNNVTLQRPPPQGH